MGAKLPDGLTYKDLKVFTKVEVEGKTLDQAAEELGCSRDTLKRTKKRGSYRDLTLQAMDEQGYGVDEYVAKLVELTKAQKLLNCGGHDVTVEDNVTQLKAIEKIGKVYGDNAPTNIDISGSLASTRDADLYDEIEEALGNPLGTSPGESGASPSDGGEV